VRLSTIDQTQLPLQDKLAHRRNGGLALAPHLGDRNWRPIAEQVTKQMSPTTLAILLAELRKTLEEQQLLQQPQTESDCSWDVPLAFLN